MLIAESSAAHAAAVSLMRAHGDGCELFREVDGLRLLAVVPGATSDQPEWTFKPVELLFSGGRYGSAAGEWLFCVGFWVPREQRTEFLFWYEREHLAILLECAAWDGCRFVEAPDATGCRFVALHQLGDPAALSSPERARSRATPGFMRLKRFDWFDEPFTRVLYRRIAVDEA